MTPEQKIKHLDKKSEITKKNSNRRILRRTYENHHLMASILNSFDFFDSMSLEQLFDSIEFSSPRSLLWSVSIVRIKLSVKQMERLKLISIKEENGEDIISLTEMGFIALQQQTYQTLASSAFIGYQTYLLNRWMVLIAVCSLAIAIISLSLIS